VTKELQGNMVQTSTSQKNIWVAASDGDLERVKVGCSSPLKTGNPG